MSASTDGARPRLPGRPASPVRADPGSGRHRVVLAPCVPLLREAGHEAIAVDLPATTPAAGLPEYARRVARAIGGRDNAVLVAMWLGGFTAPAGRRRGPGQRDGVRERDDPRPGETPGEWWDDTGWSDARVAAANRGGYSAEFDLAGYFLHDVPPDIAAAGEPYQRPEADVAFGSACDFDAWPPVPIRAVAGADDRFSRSPSSRRWRATGSASRRTCSRRPPDRAGAPGRLASYLLAL